MNNNINETICEAIDTIVSKRLEGISYDTTILCTIIKDDEREEGKYTVSHNDTVSFVAYSSDTTYRKGNNVYVHIPQGKWEEQKIIVGKKTSKEEDPYVVQLPFSKFLDMTGNLLADANLSQSGYGLVANGTEPFIQVWNSDAAFKQASYTRLGLRAGFKSWLNPFYINGDETPRHVTHGDYGIELQLMGIDTAGQAKSYTMPLTTADMNGNPYDFESFYEQEIVFDISDIKQITSCGLKFYQTAGSFIDDSNQPIPHLDSFDNEILANLFVDNIYLAFGYDMSEYNDETAIIFTLDEETYSKDKTEEENTKTVSLRWIHKLPESDTLKLVDENYLNELQQDNTIEIRWYRRTLGTATVEGEEVAGPSWTRIAEANDFDVTFIADTTLVDERIKAIVLFNDAPIRSNIITFENENEVLNQPTLDAAVERMEALTALSIWCDDGTYGNYRIYNYGNRLLDQSNASITRTWTPKLDLYEEPTSGDKEEQPGEEEQQPIVVDNTVVEAEWIEWTVPIIKTMIEIDDYSQDQLSEDGTQVIIRKYGDADNGYDISNNNTLEYRIRGYYSQQHSNNTIQCRVRKDGIEYTATKEMTFGPAGTTGTDYTFILDFERGVTALPIADTSKAVNVVAQLYDYENKQIDISGYNIVWGWKTTQSLFSIYNTADNYRKEIQQIGSGITSANYSILTATLTFEDLELIAYLPIPLRASANDYAYISGTTNIMYNSSGELLDYYKNPLKLYSPDGNEITNISWEVVNAVAAENGGYYDDNNNFIESNTVNRYTPSIVYTAATGEYRLQPLNFYVKDTCKNVCLVARRNGSVVWAQPLLIGINRYPASIINKWDGKLVVDEDSQIILSPRIVAGSKNDKNQFSGVVMGDWTGENAGAELTKITGVYGYADGEQSFAFKEDGTAFIGKASGGRIVFNGIESTIQSAGYEAGAGMKIDIDDGTIEAHQFTLSASKNDAEEKFITISTEAETYPLEIGKYLKVEWDGTLTLSNINITGGLISSGDDSGMVIDVTNGTIKADKFTLEAGEAYTSGYLALDSTKTKNYPLEIGQYLKVEWDGSLIANYLTALKGSKLGPWYITQTGFANAETKETSSVYLDSDGTLTMGQTGCQFVINSSSKQISFGDTTWNMKNQLTGFLVQQFGYLLNIYPEQIIMGQPYDVNGNLSNQIIIYVPKSNPSMGHISIGNGKNSTYINSNGITIGTGSVQTNSGAITLGDNSNSQTIINSYGITLGTGMAQSELNTITIGSGESPVKITPDIVKTKQLGIYSDKNFSAIAGTIGYIESNTTNTSLDGAETAAGIGIGTGNSFADSVSMIKATGNSVGIVYKAYADATNTRKYYNGVFITQTYAKLQNDYGAIMSYVNCTKDQYVEISPALHVGTSASILNQNLTVYGNIKVRGNITDLDGNAITGGSSSEPVYAKLA